MNNKKFLIFAPPYATDDGGSIVIHRLCALLNDLGKDAYLTPLYHGEPIYANDFIKPIAKLLKQALSQKLRPFKTNSEWNTPIIKNPNKILNKDWIVIYPEIVFGNPLGAKNVVRWLLHNPGFHNDRIFFGTGEYIVDFNTFANGFIFPGSTKAEKPLNLLVIPFEHYNLEGATSPDERKGTAYCLRKGAGKQIGYKLNDATLIDGLSHKEISSIFKKVKQFISFDTHTAYSSFAVLCGAESVVIPDPGVPKEKWYPNEADRFGIAYGFDDLEWAKKTAPLVYSHLKAKQDDSTKNIMQFVKDVQLFFN